MRFITRTKRSKASRISCFCSSVSSCVFFPLPLPRPLPFPPRFFPPSPGRSCPPREKFALAEPPPIWAEFNSILAEIGFTGGLQEIERFAFYQAARGPDVALTIATAEQRIYGNILLTIGVVTPA